MPAGLPMFRRSWLTQKKKCRKRFIKCSGDCRAISQDCRGAQFCKLIKWSLKWCSICLLAAVAREKAWSSGIMAVQEFCKNQLLMNLDGKGEEPNNLTTFQTDWKLWKGFIEMDSALAGFESHFRRLLIILFLLGDLFSSNYNPAHDQNFYAVHSSLENCVQTQHYRN